MEDSNTVSGVKSLLISSNFLVHFDSTLPTIVTTDASEYGIGGVLAHRFPDGTEKPVAFTSRSLTSAEKHYSVIDREALAIIFTVTKFHCYLYGKEFTLKTDHKPLVRLFGHENEIPKIATSRLTRWALILSSYMFKVEFSKGSEVKLQTLFLDYLCQTLESRVSNRTTVLVFFNRKWRI